jgi:hypothetical protein
MRHSLRHYRRKTRYSSRLQYRALRSVLLLGATAGSALLLMRLLVDVQ